MRDRDIIYRLNADWNRKTIRVKRAGGQTNRNYVVEHKKKKFFVRLPWETHVINRTIEGQNILALSKNKKLVSILPKYHAYVLNKKNILNPKERDVFDVPDGTVVADYIEAREFTAKDFTVKESQKTLAKTLCIFHESGVRFVNKYDVFADEIAKYRIAAQKHNTRECVDDAVIAFFKNAEKQAKKKIVLTTKGIGTHNDFIFQNFLLDKKGKVYILDFEYAGMNMRGGRYYDFGFLFADNLFRRPVITKKTFEEFLSVADTMYKKKLDREQVYATVSAVIVMQFWWGIVRYFSVQTKKEKHYFAEYIKVRAKKAEDLLRNLQM